MKKESIARVILIISIIILLSTGVMTTTTGSLFPIFAFIVLLISVFLAIWAFQGIKHEKHMRERAQKLSEEKQRAFDEGKGAGSFLLVEFPGAIYHIASGGNARQPIFPDDTDREFLLELVSSMVTKLE